MTKSVTHDSNSDSPWTIVMDDSCPVVRKLGWIVRQWDKHSTFRFIGKDSECPDTAELIAMLSKTPWSLMLVDYEGHCWHGPEAIPFILKNLPSGKIAAVSYTIPGTMWLTRKLYYMVSRNRRLLAQNANSSEYKAA